MNKKIFKTKNEDGDTTSITSVDLDRPDDAYISIISNLANHIQDQIELIERIKKEAGKKQYKQTHTAIELLRNAAIACNYLNDDIISYLKSDESEQDEN